MSREQFYQALDNYFDEGWKHFVKDVQYRNSQSNQRMFRIIQALKGNEFLKDLIILMGKEHKYALVHLTRNPKGILLNNSKSIHIPKLIVNKYPSGSYREGEIYIQIKEDRWIWFVF